VRHAVKKRGGILTVHERACSALHLVSPPFGGRPHNLRALDEMIELAERPSAAAVFSPDLCWRSSWKTVDESLELIDKARARGVDIAYDLYSLTFGVSVITVVLPAVPLSAGQEKAQQGDTGAPRCGNRLTKRRAGFGFEDIQIACLGPGHEDLCGKRVSEIAEEWKTPEIDAYLKLSK
jgi:N-acyl-D-aspartate/D-glutamate deacylase